MTWHHSRRYLPGTPHPSCSKRASIRYNPFHYLRSILFPRIFLSILPLQPRPNPRTGRLLTTHRHYHPWPIWGSPSKHGSSPCLRSYSNLSSPQHHGRRPKRGSPIFSTNDFTRLLFYLPSRYRILWSPFYDCRRSLWLYILCSHRLPWPSCHYWFHIPRRLPTSPNPLPLYIWTPFWIRSSRLILTFRRRCLTIPVRFHLLMRILIFLVSTPV